MKGNNKRIQNRSLIVIAVLTCPFILLIAALAFDFKRDLLITALGLLTVLVLCFRNPKFLYWVIFWKYDFISKKGYPLLIELEPNISPENYYRVYCREIVDDILENGYERDIILVGKVSERPELAKEYKIIGYNGFGNYGDLVEISEIDKQLRSLRLNKMKLGSSVK